MRPTAQSWAISCVLLKQSTSPFLLSFSLEISQTMFNQIDFVSSFPTLTLAAAIFPHRMQSSLKLYVSLPLWNLSIARSPETGGGETFCTFLSDTFTPPAEPAATHTGRLQPCISSFKPTEPGEHSHDCCLYTSKSTNLPSMWHHSTGRAHLRLSSCVCVSLFYLQWKSLKPNKLGY